MVMVTMVTTVTTVTWHHVLLEVSRLQFDSIFPNVSDILAVSRVAQSPRALTATLTTLLLVPRQCEPARWSGSRE